MTDRRSFIAGTAALALSGMAKAELPVWTSTGTIRRAGGVMHYAMRGERGQKPPLVVLHKLGGWLADWNGVAPALAEGRQVIALDLPGHGGSKWPEPPPYIQTQGESAAAVIGVLDELGIDKADIAGTSLGGCLGVVLASAWPDRVRRLAIISSALRERRSLSEIRTNIDEKQTNLYDRRGLPYPVHKEQLEGTFGVVHSAELAIAGNLSRKAAGRWIQPSERGVAAYDFTAALRRIEAPVLLVYGQFDNAYFKYRSGVEAALRHSRAEIVPNSGAFVIEDNPATTAPVLSRFFDEA
jgi:pimeloyl-ACP methyl ester carboxylesterase